MGLALIGAELTIGAVGATDATATLVPKKFVYINSCHE